MSEIKKKSCIAPVRAFSFSEWLKEGGSSTLRKYAFNDAYQRMAWVYACVNIIATTASSAPLVFYKGPNQNVQNRIDDKDHPVNQLFQTPKEPEIHSLRELLYRSFIYMGIVGGVWWVFGIKRGRMVTVEPKVGMKALLSKGYIGKLQGWEGLNEDGEVEQYPISRVLPIGNFNPLNQYVPLSPLNAARLSVESELSISGWNNSFFKTGMKNPLLLQARGTLTKDQRRDIKREITDYFSGIEGAHGALLLQGNIDVTPLTVNPKDIDFIQGKKLNREEITAIFGVPPALVGILEHSNYSNVHEQRKIFWENTLLPKMNQIRDLIQVNILDKRFPGITCSWDTSKIIGLREEGHKLAEAAKMYWEIGYTHEQISVILNAPELNPLQNKPGNSSPPNPALTPTPTSAPSDNEGDEPASSNNSFTKKLDFDRLIEDHRKSFATLLTASKSSVISRWENWVKYKKEYNGAVTKVEKELFDKIVGKEFSKIADRVLATNLKLLYSFDELSVLDKQVEFVKNRIKDAYHQELHSQKESTLAILFEYSKLNEFNAEEFNKILDLVLRSYINKSVYTIYSLANVREIEWVSEESCHLNLEGSRIDMTDKFYLTGSKFPCESLDHNCKCMIIPTKLPGVFNLYN